MGDKSAMVAAIMGDKSAMVAAIGAATAGGKAVTVAAIAVPIIPIQVIAHTIRATVRTGDTGAGDLIIHGGAAPFGGVLFIIPTGLHMDITVVRILKLLYHTAYYQTRSLRLLLLRTLIHLQDLESLHIPHRTPETAVRNIAMRPLQDSGFRYRGNGWAENGCPLTGLGYL
ncbi:MAG: hypothetical protein C0392_13660 [Syntrophus sp. (in: bacteria)]|nr:hypothetical protein [Syntrophus sp. (in: bacteria)]